jgi:urea transport system substrate-binding protein
MARTPESPPSAVGMTRLTCVTDIDPAVTLAASFPFITPSAAAGVMGQFGPYPVVRFLGAGAAGFVFEAFDEELDRAVVLKVLRPELAANDDHRRRFVREAKAAAAVTSDYTVPIYAVGEHAGLPFLEMPLLVGESLQQRLSRVRVLPVDEGLEVARQTALGLADAHAVGLIHRDIKPANLWIEPDPGGGIRRVRLLDFGLARQSQTAGHLTLRGAVIGTPHYMSPEQAQGDPLDHRSDLFALGVTLYALLTGALPFSGSSVTATLVALATRPHAPADHLNPEIPPRASALIDRLLAKRPADRPATAEGVAEELADLLRERGVEFRPRGASGVVATPGFRLSAAEPAKSVRRPDPAGPHPSSLLSPTTPMPVVVTPTEAVGLRPVPRRRPPPRWDRWVAVLAVGICAVAAVVFARWPAAAPVAPPDTSPILVGVLHSQSGTMKLSEDPVLDATLLAIDEVNAGGGVSGRKLVAVVADGQSEPDVFAAEAERLLTRERVAVLFGCWTSASRKAVRPVVERHGGLLFYPVPYEGLEQSPAVVYLGHAPNQQLLPAVDFLVTEQKARRLYLVGSDSVFPRAANRIIRDHIGAKYADRAEVAGETYRPLGDDNWAKTVTDIVETRPDAVLNTINGSSAFAFYRDLRAKEDLLGLPHTPVLSVSLTANELGVMKPADVAGDLLAGTHFDLPDQPSAFRDQFRKRFGADRPTTDMMASAYAGVHLWAKAATAAGGTEPAKVRAAVAGRSFDGPTGQVTVDADTFHLWQPVRIAEVQADGRLKLVYAADGGRPVKPEPFPPTRSPEDWERFLKGLQVEYGGRWQAPQGK